MILIAVTLAVAAIPEGIPLCVTISLSTGCSDMVKQNVLVRRIAAVETLGCASVICTDKTGTLTEGKMTMVKMWAAVSGGLGLWLGRGRQTSHTHTHTHTHTQTHKHTDSHTTKTKTRETTSTSPEKASTQPPAASPLPARTRTPARTLQ